MAIDPRNEEEKKKRQQEFERGRAGLGLGAGNKPAGMLGVSALAQQAPKAAEAPAQLSPQLAAQQAHQQRQQNTASQQASTQQAQVQQQAQAQQKVAAYQNDPMKARREMLAANEVRQGNTAAPTAQQAVATPKPQAAAATSPSNNRKASAPKGINLDFPIVGKKTDGTDKWDAKDYPQVHASRAPAPEEPITENYTDQPAQQPQQATKIGFNPATNQPNAMTEKSGSNIRMPNAPRETWGERNERENRMRMIATPHKGSQNGQLTIGQMRLLDDMGSRDQKYANDQYTSQLNSATQLATTGMGQEGANERAALGEANANNRFNSQMGFDAAKFEETANQQRQGRDIDERRLAMQEKNASIANYSTERLNALSSAYDAAQSDEDRSAITAQIQALKGTSDKKQAPVVISQTGETMQGIDKTKNPSVVYDPNTKEFIELPTAERAPNDAPMLALQQSGKYTKEQKGEIYDIYMAGGDISGYLE